MECLFYVIPAVVIYVVISIMLLAMLIDTAKDFYRSLKWYFPYYNKKCLNDLFMDGMQFGIAVIMLSVFIMASYKLFH